MSIFKDFLGLSLKRSVGNMMDNEEHDVISVKNALHETGYSKVPARNGIIDQATENAIQSF